jgi:hypothetical protein
MKTMSEISKAYMAGLIDGDGSIIVQLVRKEGYKYLYQIRVSVVISQKTKRYWALIEYQKEIGGTLRQKPEGVSELAIVGMGPVKALLLELLPYLRMKKRTAELVLEIIDGKNKAVSKDDFIEVCKKVDKVGELTESKGRKNTSEVVEKTITHLT